MEQLNKQLPPMLEVVGPDGQLVAEDQDNDPGVTAAEMDWQDNAAEPLAAEFSSAEPSITVDDEDSFGVESDAGNIEMAGDQTFAWGDTYPDSNENLDEFGPMDVDLPAETESLMPMSVNATPHVNIKPSNKRKRNNSSGLMTGLKVILGGLLAVPVAAGILAAIGQPLPIDIWPFGGERDRFQANIERQQRVKEENGGQSVGGSGARQGDDSKSEPNQQQQSERSSTSLSSSLESDSSLDTVETSPADPASQPPTTEITTDFSNGLRDMDSSARTEPPVNAAEPANQAMASVVLSEQKTAIIDSPSIEQTTPTDSSTDTARLAPSPSLAPAIPVKQSSSVSMVRFEPLSDEVKSSVAKANDKLAAALALPADDKSRRRQLARAFLEISILGEEVRSPTDDAAVMDLLSFVKKSAAVPNFREFVSYFVDPANREKRRTQGILMIGQAVREDGVPVIRFDSGKQVYVDTDEPFLEGEIIALGRLVEPPDDAAERVKILASELIE